MTLARTALRLATIAALQGADGSSGPTIANNRVYDSRIDDFSPETYPSDALPTIIVYTDQDEGEGLSLQNGGPPFKRLISLVMEFAMVQGFDVPREDGGTEFVPGYPATDAEHEASLDFLEFQITRQLAYALDPLPTMWRSFTRVRKYDCHRNVLDDTGVKIAARILTWQVEVNDDQVITHNSADTLPTAFNVLPEPLRRVAAALPDGKAFDTCVAIAKMITPVTAPSLDKFTMQVVGKDLSDMDFNAEILSGLSVPQIVASASLGAIDYQRGVQDTLETSYQQLILDATIAALSVTGWPRFGVNAKLILQITNTGSFGITAWPGVVWASGSLPVITVGAGKRDIVILTSPDSGATIFGNVVGQDYS